MEFARPAWLALAVLAIPIVILHLRRRRRVRIVVPSLLAFDPAALGPAPPRVTGFLPRDLLALLLELGALAGLTLAAAGPFLGGAAAKARALAIVLDGSASTMAAGRFEEEVALARRAVEAAGPGTPVTLLLAAGEPRVIASLDGARPRAVGAGALGAAAEAAVRSGAEVLVLTDGCDPDPLPEGVRVVSVGRPERNRGIVGCALDLRRDGNHGLFVLIREEDGSIREEDRSAGAKAPFRVALPAGDALAADDVVEIPCEPPRPLRVGVVGKADPFLSAALEASADVLDREQAGSPDVLVGIGAEGTTPALVFGAGEGDVLEAPSVQAGDRLHPVMRGVDTAEWILTRGRTLEARAGDAVLLQGPRGPLALARPGRVLLGFLPGESTLPLSASWPVFLRNALLFLAGDPAPAVPRGLLDAAESDLVPRLPRNADGFLPPARPGPGGGPRPLEAPFAAAAAALLLLEWIRFALRRESFGAAGGGS